MASPFKVVYLPLALQQFREVHAWAKDKALAERVLEVGKDIDQQLRLDPIGFGDPTYRLPNLGLQVYVRCMTPVTVHYAVNEALRVVFVRHFGKA